MEKRIVSENGIRVAILDDKDLLIIDAQSALDLIATIDYHDDCQRIAIHKEAIVEDFFKLSTGIAGDILQKFTNYAKKIAIIGDFSNYESKPLQDFIYESNKGNAIFFVTDETTAIHRLMSAK
jgi:hypothetical protein